MAINGIERVRINTLKQFERITGPVTERAVYSLLSYGSGVAATITPIDTSNLVNSQYAPQITKSGGRTEGHVGYTADYAAAVHAMPGVLAGLPRMNGNGSYWDPAGEPGFLEKGMEEARKTGPEILRKTYRV